MKNILSTIGNGILMLIGVIFAIFAVAIMDLVEAVCLAIQWVVMYDRWKPDTRHPVTIMQDEYQKFVATHPIKKLRHNIRGRDGRFVKRSLVTMPGNILTARAGTPITIQLANR